MDSCSIVGKFAMDAEVLDIGNGDVILGLSWLTENGFWVDTQDRWLRNVNSGQVIPCSVGCIPEVYIMEVEPIEEGEILLIIDASEQYYRYTQSLSAKQAARHPEHKSCDHQIPLQDPNVNIPTGAIYKTTWEKDEGLCKYLQENIPNGKVRRSRSPAAAPILFVRTKDSYLRLCLHYRALNHLTISNKYPLPLISKLLNRQGAEGGSQG